MNECSQINGELRSFKTKFSVLHLCGQLLELSENGETKQIQTRILGSQRQTALKISITLQRFLGAGWNTHLAYASHLPNKNEPEFQFLAGNQLYDRSTNRRGCCQKRPIVIFTHKQRHLSIDMKTKDVQHVPRINISNLTLDICHF